MICQTPLLVKVTLVRSKLPASSELSHKGTNDLFDVAGTVAEWVVLVVSEVVDENLALIDHEDFGELFALAELNQQHGQHNHGR